ncbi:putative signal transducing protein [Dehalogenimonas etheniformans]|nr:DUF2007 domain-containing protein [Dehalogenimonas etheniformans]QNT75735.1 DUF2007 domain-containing protein [Dehalogenimonas etheniformans]
MKYHENFSVVAIVQGELRASVTKSRLESAGIPVLLEYESAGRVIGINIDGLGEVKILVPKSFEDEAKQVLKTEMRPTP